MLLKYQTKEKNERKKKKIINNCCMWKNTKTFILHYFWTGTFIQRDGKWGRVYWFNSIFFLVIHHNFLWIENKIVVYYSCRILVEVTSLLLFQVKHWCLREFENHFITKISRSETICIVHVVIWTVIKSQQFAGLSCIFDTLVVCLRFLILWEEIISYYRHVKLVILPP